MSTAAIVQNEYRKAQWIANDLRQQIVARRLPPASRLPTRSELVTRYEVSNATIQRAVDQLVADGFVETDGRRGTFVAEAGPHLTRYAIVIPHDAPPGGLPENRLYAALVREALALTGTRRACLFYGSDGQGIFSYHDQLVEDIRASRYAGILFAGSPFRLKNSPLLTEPGIPRVALTSHSIFPGVAGIWLDLPAFFARAVERLQREGVRQPAVLFPAQAGPNHLAMCEQAITAAGMTLRDDWMLGLSQHHEAWTERAVRLLFRADATSRPDGLVIVDDNLVEAASRGLVAAGVRVPQTLRVIAHCNYPWPPASQVPAIQLGLDVRALLAEALAGIDAQRRGEPPRPQLNLPPLFADELPPSPPRS